MHCPEATSYLDMNVSSTKINYAICTDILLLHMSSDCALPLVSRNQSLERSIHNDTCVRETGNYSREGSSPRAESAQSEAPNKPKLKSHLSQEYVCAVKQQGGGRGWNKTIDRTYCGNRLYAWPICVELPCPTCSTCPSEFVHVKNSFKVCQKYLNAIRLFATVVDRVFLDCCLRKTQKQTIRGNQE